MESWTELSWSEAVTTFVTQPEQTPEAGAECSSAAWGCFRKCSFDPAICHDQIFSASHYFFPLVMSFLIPAPNPLRVYLTAVSGLPRKPSDRLRETEALSLRLVVQRTTGTCLGFLSVRTWKIPRILRQRALAIEKGRGRHFA